MTSSRSNRSLPRLPVVLLGLLTILSVSARADTPSGWDDYDQDRVEVVLAPGTTIGEINRIYGTTTVDSLPPSYLLALPVGATPDTMVAAMTPDSSRLALAERSYRDGTPEAVRQMVVAAVGGTIHGYLDQHVTDRVHLGDIQAHTEGEGLVVAVLDTGVNTNHPALAGALLPEGYNFVDNNSDVSDRADGIDEDQDGVADEGAGHGTMVAGIVHLVAPGARILPVRILDDEGKGHTFNVAKGIRYAVQHGARIINLSMGLNAWCGIVAREVWAAHDAGVAIIGAAGNDGAAGNGFFPANDPDVLEVAAADSNDVKAPFSNYGSKVAITAPGVGIYAPFYDGHYAIGAGTSFAAPFVSGQCALILSLDPTLSLDQLYARAQQGVVDIYRIASNQVYRNQLGSGRFDGRQTWLVGPCSACSSPATDAPVQSMPNPARIGQPVRIVWTGFPPSGGATLGLEPSSSVWSGSIFDLQGRRVRSLGPWPATGRSAGGAAEWDGRDDRGHLVADGLYFVKLENPLGMRRGRVLVLR